MFEGLRAIESFLLVKNEELADQVLAFIRYISKLIVVEVVIGLLNLTEDISSTASLEWQIAADESVQKDTKGPEIGSLTVGTVKDFRSHVVWSTGNSGQLLVAARSLGKTEIDETHGVR